jgi:predicted homoserine dehydrogenase-like protein
LLLFILTLVVLSCQEETALKNVCADPLGAEDITLENNDQFCYKEGFNACFVMQFTTTSQVIKAVDNTSIYPGTMIAMIIDVGAVSCLGDVTGKPTSGFVASAEALEKHGYVVKLPDNTYGRLFVDSWTKSSSGVVSEINITWQYAF